MRATMHVLAVDPCADTVTSLTWLLELWGYEVRSARSGPAALEVARSFEPDVVLTEVVLPGLDGCALAAALRRRGPSRPLLVAVTGWATEAERRRCLAAGFDHFLVKPAEPAALQKLLSAWALSRLRGPTLGTDRAVRGRRSDFDLPVAR